MRVRTHRHVCECMCACVHLVPHISAFERVSRYYLVWLLGSKDCLFLQEAGTESAHQFTQLSQNSWSRATGPPGYSDCLRSGQVFKGLPVTCAYFWRVLTSAREKSVRLLFSLPLKHILMFEFFFISSWEMLLNSQENTLLCHCLSDLHFLQKSLLLQCYLSYFPKRELKFLSPSRNVLVFQGHPTLHTDVMVTYLWMRLY